MMENTVGRILNPLSIAVIGASTDPGKRGYRSLETLLADGYQGRIYPINPSLTEVLGLPCHASLAAVEGEIDVALVCTPARTLEAVIRQCGEKGLKGAVVLAGGLGEANAAGRALEQRLVRIAHRYGLRIVGPNMNGVFSARVRMNTLGWPDVPAGDIGVMSSSANIALGFVQEARAGGRVGFSTILSVGNQADLEFGDYLGALADDDRTRAVVSYVEGFKDGRAYLRQARNAVRKKPVVVYKAGRNAEGVRLAKSHSGSLAGNDAVCRGVLRQAGVTLVSRLDQVLPLAEALSVLPAMGGRRVAVISEGGGPITIAAELLHEHGLVLAELSGHSQARVRALLPNSSVTANPIDIASGTDPHACNYAEGARIALADANIDALLFVGYFGGYGLRYGQAEGSVEQAFADELRELLLTHGKPVLVQSHYAHGGTANLARLHKAGVPVFRTIEAAVDCLAAARERGVALSRLSHPVAPAAGAAPPAARSLVEAASAAGASSLLEHDARELLGLHGVALAPHVLVREAGDVSTLATVFGNIPLALKIVSPDILHKTEAGGVRLNVRGADRAGAAFHEIVASAQAWHPGARIAGVLAVPMAESGLEVIVGVAKDPQFGRVAMFGLGGVFVEALGDVAFRTLPLSPDDARDMVDGLRAHSLFEDFRGVGPLDHGAIVGLLMAVSAMCEAHPEISELDLNPVIVHRSGLSVVDARVIFAGHADELAAQPAPTFGRDAQEISA